jgi:hypothetical protein
MSKGAEQPPTSIAIDQMTDDQVVAAFLECRAWEVRVRRFIEQQVIKTLPGGQATIDVEHVIEVIEEGLAAPRRP